jgi:hypothetical protein
VLLHDFVFLIGEPAGFMEDLLVDHDLADVMEHRRDADVVDVVLVEAELLREDGAIFAHALDVVPGFAGFVGKDRREVLGDAILLFNEFL